MIENFDGSHFDKEFDMCLNGKSRGMSCYKTV
jgi:hypothetical protein